MLKTASLLPPRLMTEDAQRLSWVAYVFLVFICIASFLPGLVNLPATDRDESLFAQASKQMIESGNYIDIRVQDQPRYKKPIGIYWLQAASTQLFNPDHLNEIWSYRIPSFINAIVSVVITAALGTLFFGPAAGFFAALMMAGCVVLNVEARLAKTDATLLASIMLMQYALARAYLNSARSWIIPFVFWTALGVGILVKGPVILMVLVSTLIWLRITEKNLSWFHALRPWVGVPYTLLLTLPWFVAIVMQSHGQFLQDSAGHDLLGKIWHGQDRGFLPPGMHFLIMPGVFFPASLIVLLALPDIWARRHQASVRFFIAWIMPVWILFELSLTKLPHYVLPTYPALAILAAKMMLDGYPSLSSTRYRWFKPLILVIWLSVGIGFAVGLALLPYLSDHIWNYGQIVASIFLVLTQILVIARLIRENTDVMMPMAMGNLVFMAMVFGCTLPQLQHLWVTRQVIIAAETYKPCDNWRIVSASYDEPSLILMAGTHTYFVPDGATVAKDMRSDACVMGLVDSKHMDAFEQANSQSTFHPLAIAHIEGFNIGGGHAADLKLYVSPPRGMP